MTAAGPQAPQISPTYVPRYFIGETDAVEIDGKCFSFRSSNNFEHELIDSNGLPQKFSHETIYDLWCHRRFHIKRGHFAAEQAAASKLASGFTLQQFSEYKITKALFYTAVIEELIRFEGKKLKALTDKGYNRKAGFGNRCLSILMPVAEGIVKENWKAKRGGTPSIDITLPSPDHFRDLINRFRAANFEAVAIVDLRMGRKAVDYLENVHPDDVALWSEYAERYCSPRKPHITEIADELRAAIEERNLAREAGTREFQMPPPGILTKMIKAKGRFYLTWKRLGPKAAENEFNIVHGGLQLDRLGQRIEMDEWHANIQVLLAKAGVWETLPSELKKVIKRQTRPWLTVAIDAASRCILAISFSRYDPSHRSALRGLEMAVSDKTLISLAAGTQQRWIYGLIPEVIVTDAGAGFRHARFRAAISTLKALHMFPVTGRPQARGTIESFFNTCEKRFLQYFSGRTFTNILERGDYDSEKNASLLFDEFCLYFTRAILDIYHQTPQESLGWATPADVWLRLSHKSSMLPPVTDEERRLIFGTPVKAAISDKGVRANGLHYQHRLLQKLRYDDPRLPKKNLKARRTDILIDRFNISRISFFADGAWHEAKPTIGLPDGVSIWEWSNAAAVSMAENKENAALRLSIMLAEINRQRASGEAAMWRSELGMEAMTPKSFDDIQRRYFANEVVGDMAETNPVLAQYVSSSDPIGLPLSVIRDDNKPENDDPADAPEEAAPKADRSAFTPFRRRSRDDNYKPSES
ncbi:transposase family protein [Rhizobium sp. CFBP 13726]|uniref:integrase catalytic domain-containing protein n=1 Tax=Rhizobium sp. CFBP 13726 TaxID=2775296 RepID=UPI001785FA00|nr:DDE-type integrase/transposase/recombinase [Rhizobium sp. CFBP 13726]MBD8651164.1 transposase family protein [Rhizobium sp. CFBP 13726]